MAIFNLGVIAGFFAPVPVALLADGSFRPGAGALLGLALWCALAAVPVVACRKERLFWFAFLHAGMPMALSLLRNVA